MNEHNKRKANQRTVDSLKNENESTAEQPQCIQRTTTQKHQETTINYRNHLEFVDIGGNRLDLQSVEPVGEAQEADR